MTARARPPLKLHDRITKVGNEVLVLATALSTLDGESALAGTIAMLMDDVYERLFQLADEAEHLESSK